MGYDSIPRVGAGYIDGSFRGTTFSTQPRILILGTASKGLSYELFAVSDPAAAKKAFGADSEMLRAVAECQSQGADNIALMRIGGTQGTFSVGDALGNTLTITTEYRDDTILERYALIIQASSLDATKARVLIYDLIGTSYVFDSDEIEILDTGIVSVKGVEDWPVTSITFTVDAAGAATAVALTNLDCVSGTRPDVTVPYMASTVAKGASGFTALADYYPIVVGCVNTANSLTSAPGTDGTTMPAVARYSALEYAYQLLDFRDADIVIPCGVYHDMPNIATSHEDSDIAAVAEITSATPGSMFATGTFTLTNAASVTTTYVVNGGGAFGTQPGGAAGTSIDMFIGGAATTADIAEAVTKVINATTSGDMSASDNGVTITVTQTTAGASGNQTNTNPNSGLAAVGNFENGISGATWYNLSASAIDTSITQGNEKALPAYAGAASPALHLAGMRADSEDDFLGYVWQYRYRGRIYTFFADSTTPATANVIGPGELSGDAVPAAVYTKFNAAVSAEFRECSFTHQLASFCHRASTNWSTMLGIISYEVPPAFDRATLRDWAGELPAYAIKGSDRVVPSGGNGFGALGDKFLAGESSYRNSIIESADKALTDGLGRGGLILTEGASLPNGEPYGIKDSDEALDSNDRPVDIGRHVLVTCDWPIITSSYNGGSTYPNSIVASLAGKLATLPANLEPIGTNGGLAGIVQMRKLLISQINDFAFIRAVGMRKEESGGLVTGIIVQSKTAAHPTSDYSRISTIRSVNRELTGIRGIAKAYIGTPFSSTRLLSLQQAIDGFLKEERTAGFNQGAVCTMSYTRADKIIGKLTLKLKMIPPFSIDTIVVETSLAAEESEL